MIDKMRGNYQITSRLGRGDLAGDLNLNRKVALKFLPVAFTADPQRMPRFECGADLLSIQIAPAFPSALRGPVMHNWIPRKEGSHESHRDFEIFC